MKGFLASLLTSTTPVDDIYVCVYGLDVWIGACVLDKVEQSFSNLSTPEGVYEILFDEGF